MEDNRAHMQLSHQSSSWIGLDYGLGMLTQVAKGVFNIVMFVIVHHHILFWSM